VNEHPYQQFPVGALPGPLRSFVHEGSGALGCDPAMIALPCLSVVGAAIGNSRSVKLKHSWREPSILWSAVISDSGTLKSPAFRLAIDRARALERKLRERHEAAKEEATAARNNWMERKARGDKDLGPMPLDPPLPRVVANDCTLERLAQLLAENPKGMLLARDELSGWFKSFERYSKGSDLPQWLEFFNGGSLSVDRKTGEEKHLSVERASVSVTGSIQPGVFARAVRGEGIESGLAARLLLAMPPRREKVWTECDIDPATTAKYEQVLERLYDLEPRTDGSGRRVPLALSLDRDAREVWKAFYGEWAARQRDAEGAMAAALSKLEGYCARLALIHHCCTCAGHCLDDSTPIRRESIESGITLARWFAGESERAYATLGESDTDREQRQLVDWIAARGGSTTSRRSRRRRHRAMDGRAALWARETGTSLHHRRGA
jgi:hypothetical protein